LDRRHYSIGKLQVVDKRSVFIVMANGEKEWHAHLTPGDTWQYNLVGRLLQFLRVRGPHAIRTMPSITFDCFINKSFVACKSYESIALLKQLSSHWPLSRSDNGWSGGLEDTTVGSGWGSLSLRQLWEPKVFLAVLSGGSSQNFWVWDDWGLDDMNGISSGTVSTGHLAVKHGYSLAHGSCSILFVHVDVISSCKISNQDSVVLNAIGLSLEDFTNWDDLSLDSSDLVLSLHLVPEFRLGKDGVLGENSNSIAGWLCFFLSRKLSSNNPELFELNDTKQVIIEKSTMKNRVEKWRRMSTATGIAPLENYRSFDFCVLRWWSAAQEADAEK